MSGHPNENTSFSSRECTGACLGSFDRLYKMRVIIFLSRCINKLFFDFVAAKYSRINIREVSGLEGKE